VLGGIWADRFGGKLVLGIGVLWWSLATALTPVAASLGLPALLVARCLMGIGEGVAMPAMNNMLSKWVEPLACWRAFWGGGVDIGGVAGAKE
jgi:ACS family sodium-dependent inorganic phosphate cotransporter